MDSQATTEGLFIDLISDAWRSDTLPKEDIPVPAYELPDPEADSGDVTLTLKEQEEKWSDIALFRLSEL